MDGKARGKIINQKYYIQSNSRQSMERSILLQEVVNHFTIATSDNQVKVTMRCLSRNCYFSSLGAILSAYDHVSGELGADEIALSTIMMKLN